MNNCDDSVEVIAQDKDTANETNKQSPEDIHRLYLKNLGLDNFKVNVQEKLDTAHNNILKSRKEQDELYFKVVTTEKRSDLKKLYSSMIAKKYDESLKSKMLRIIHSGPFEEQGMRIKVPLDYHKGPYMNREDEYVIIYGPNESKINGNCNNVLINTIDNSEVTYGMVEYAEGTKWNNALICYNKNSIVVRDNDNKYGQPGFLTGFVYYDGLGVEIMKRYIINGLIRKVNELNFSKYTDAESVKGYIETFYLKVRTSLLERLDNPNISDITEDELFSDAPQKEELNKVIDDKDRRIADLERRISILEQRLERVLNKIDEIEDIALDSSIKCSEKVIEKTI